MNAISIHADYRLALAEIKQRIQATQTRAVLAANYVTIGDGFTF